MHGQKRPLRINQNTSYQVRKVIFFWGGIKPVPDPPSVARVPPTSYPSSRPSLWNPPLHSPEFQADLRHWFCPNAPSRQRYLTAAIFSLYLAWEVTMLYIAQCSCIVIHEHWVTHRCMLSYDSTTPSSCHVTAANYRWGIIIEYIDKKVCYRWLHSAPRVKRETRILPIGGRCL